MVPCGVRHYTERHLCLGQWRGPYIFFLTKKKCSQKHICYTLKAATRGSGSSANRGTLNIRGKSSLKRMPLSDGVLFLYTSIGRHQGRQDDLVI